MTSAWLMVSAIGCGVAPESDGGESTAAADPDDDVRGGAVCLREHAEQLGDDALSITVDWSPTADLLLVGSTAHLRLVKVGTEDSLQTLAQFDGHRDRIYARWSPDGRLAMTGSDDETAKLLAVDADAGTIGALASLSLAAGSVYSVAWSPDGRSVLTGTASGRIHLLSVDALATRASERLLVRDLNDAHTGKVFSVAWSPDGTRALSASGDHTLRLLAVDTEAGTVTVLDTLRDVEEFVPVAWSADGRRAVAGQWGSINALVLVAIDDDHLSVMHRLDVHDSGSRAVVWRDGRVLTGAHDHGVAALHYDAVTDGLVLDGRLDDAGIGVHALSWSPDGQRLARASSKADRVSVVGIRDTDPETGCP